MVRSCDLDRKEIARRVRQRTADSGSPTRSIKPSIAETLQKPLLGRVLGTRRRHVGGMAEIGRPEPHLTVVFRFDSEKACENELTRRSSARKLPENSARSRYA